MKFPTPMATLSALLLLPCLGACADGDAGHEDESMPRAEAPGAVAGSATVEEESPGLLARAGISADSARAVASARVPGGSIVKAEIEEEDGRLVYSFDLRVQGRSGVEEVLVDASNGQVVSLEHETAEDEAAESEDEDEGREDDDDAARDTMGGSVQES